MRLQKRGIGEVCSVILGDFHGGLREVAGEGERDAKISEDRPSGGGRRRSMVGEREDFLSQNA